MRSIFLSLFFAAFAFSQDYFPLQVGNQWIYQVNGSLRLDPVVMEIAGTVSIDNVTYFTLRGLTSEMLVRKNDEGTLVIYDTAEKREKTWVPFGAATGEAFQTEVDPCNRTGVIRSRNAVIKLPVGEFNNGLEVGYQTFQCADAGLVTETFLPDVGLVQRRITTIAGERSYDLVYARVNDSTVVTGPELGFGVSLDKTTYGPGQRVLVRITIRNTKNTPLELTFPSGQDFDVVIRNEKGEEVYRWSQGRVFTQAIRQVRIEGERNWSVAIDLDQRFFDLVAGNYTLTANLAVIGPKFESTIGFVRTGPQ